MPTIKPETLREAPRQLRSSIARGLAAAGDSPAIDRTGGDYGAGILRGFAVITRGEALGHDVWIDSVFLDQVEAGLKSGNGVRARFTHPGMSADGLGRKLGRVKFSARDGDVVRGDLHFSQASHSTPDGDLASYVIDLAEEDPDLFGASIAFEIDREAEWEFAIKHGAEQKVYLHGPYLDFTNFKSPDPDNKENLPHARLAELRATDIVDEPAANPSGIFHASPIPAEADALAEFVLGLTDETPAAGVLAGIDADRMRGFASRFLSRRGLSLAPINKGGDMPKTNLSDVVDAGDPIGETTADEGESGGKGDGGTSTSGGEGGGEGDEGEEPGPVAGDGGSGDGGGSGEGSASAGGEREGLSAQFNRYVEKFGVENGPKWFSENVSWSDAVERQNALLSAENKALNEKLTAAIAAGGEAEPVTFSPEGGSGDGKPRQGLTSGQARFAAGIKMPANS